MQKVVAVLAVASAAFAASAQEQLTQEATGGFRFAANTVLLDPSSAPRPLPIRVPDGLEAEAVKEASKVFDVGVTRAALISRNGEIFYEKYARGVSASSTPLGFSMSKTLVALAVGKAHCAGAIQSLDDPAKTYAPQLAGLSYGEATVRQLLTMTSGAARSDFYTGHPSAQESFLLRNTFQARGADVDLLDRMKANTGYAKPGTEFNYNNYDTQALVFVIEGASRSDFAAYFEENIWRSVGAETSGAWLRNHNATVLGYVGFSAAPRDYMRIGHWLLAEMQTPDSCFARFVADAAAKHIAVNDSRGYGYQLHKLSLRLAPESFWLLGFGGQILGVDPPSRTVVYLYQGQDKVTPDWVRLTATLMSKTR